MATRLTPDFFLGLGQPSGPPAAFNAQPILEATRQIGVKNRFEQGLAYDAAKTQQAHQWAVEGEKRKRTQELLGKFAEANRNRDFNAARAYADLLATVDPNYKFQPGSEIATQDPYGGLPDIPGSAPVSLPPEPPRAAADDPYKAQAIPPLLKQQMESPPAPTPPEDNVPSWLKEGIEARGGFGDKPAPGAKVQLPGDEPPADFDMTGVDWDQAAPRGTEGVQPLDVTLEEEPEPPAQQQTPGGPPAPSPPPASGEAVPPPAGNLPKDTLPRLGERWRLTGPDGGTLFEYGGPRQIAEARDRVRVAMQPLIDNARTPEEAAAGKIAQSWAEKFLEQSPGVTVADATEKGEELWNRILGRDAHVEARVRSAELQRQGQAAMASRHGDASRRWAYEQVDKYAQEADARFDVKDRRQRLQSARDALSRLDMNLPLSDMMQLGSTIKAAFDSRPSDSERRQILEAAGKWNALWREVKQWFSNNPEAARLPPGFVSQMKALAAASIPLQEAVIEEAGEYAADRVTRSPAVQEWFGEGDPGDRARQAVTGKDVVAAPRSGPAPKKADPEVDAILKGAGY